MNDVVTQLNMQESSDWFIVDGYGPWPIFSCRTFREMLAETQRRGQLFWHDQKVLRFEGDFLPVVDEIHGGQMALAVPGPMWTFWGGR